MNRQHSSASNVIALWQREETMTHPIVSDLIGYWETLRGARDVPRRSEVDPRDIRDMLSHAFILDHVRPGTIRFRLAGSHLTELMGMDVRGMPLRAFFELRDRKRLMEHVETVFAGPCALDMELVSDAQGRRPLEGRMTLLPLRAEDGQITRALGAFVTDGVIGLPPRRFRIRTLSLAPVQPGRPVNRRAPPALAGFSEPAAPYNDPDAPRPAGRPSLRLVPGGRH